MVIQDQQQTSTMSITLNNSDFQCLQDQLVDLKTKNYELAEKIRRSQADFEAAKAKICSLQLKLEEQERDFQVTSTTLRRELEATTKNINNADELNDESENGGKDGDYKVKYKKLLHKAKELQQRYEKSVGVIQQMDDKIKEITTRASKFEDENNRLKEELEDKQQKIINSEQDLDQAMEKYKQTERVECLQHVEELEVVKNERDSLKVSVDRLKAEVEGFTTKIDSLTEERKIQDKKSSRMIKELKRQLTSEKNHNETLQKRLQSFLSESTTNGPGSSSSNDLENKTRISSSSSGNRRGSRGLECSGGNNDIHCDDNSVSSWSLVARAKTSTPSMCSIESGDRETVQLPASSNNNSDTLSQISQQQSPSSKSTSRLDLVFSQNSCSSPARQEHSSSLSLTQYSDNIEKELNRGPNSVFGLKFEDQAELIERVTRLQQDKWTLEEKLSYMEQANAVLTQDLADKSQIVRQFFIDQAIKSAANKNQSTRHGGQLQNSATIMIHGPLSGGSTARSPSRRDSFPSNFNQLITEKPSLKKMVDFLKERSQISSINGGHESETLTREATKKMQVMLEETLIKCLKLQENLDLVTMELNKSKI